MKWVFSALVCWIILLLLIDLTHVRKLIFAGILAVIMQLAFDTLAIQEDLYFSKNGMITLWGSSVFFTVGVSFPMGIMAVQHISSQAKYQALNIVAWSLLFLLFEYVAIRNDMLIHHHWNLALSLSINIMAMATLSWFGSNFIKSSSVRSDP